MTATPGSPIQVEHYSDLLCVWAYVAQIRVDELRHTFGDQLKLKYRFVNVFGDTGHKFEGWQDRGGLAGYREHVHKVAAGFDHVVLHQDVWREDVPASSLSPHHFLRAVSLACGEEALERAAWAMRLAFFRDGRNIARREVQLAVLGELDLPQAEILAAMDDGRAQAALAEDLRLAVNEGVTGSPTLVFNEGRQHIYGNVGYRVIEANMRELLERPSDQCSWC